MFSIKVIFNDILSVFFEDVSLFSHFLFTTVSLQDKDKFVQMSFISSYCSIAWIVFFKTHSWIFNAWQQLSDPVSATTKLQSPCKVVKHDFHCLRIFTNIC